MRIKARTTSEKPAGRGCSLLFCSILILGSLAIFALLSYIMLVRVTPYFWKKTSCTIIESSVVQLSESSDYGYRHEARLKYRYVFEGQDYENTRARISGAKFDKPSDARRLQRRYPVNQPAVCFVNPDQPAQSVLERDSLWVGLLYLIPLALGTAGVIGFRRSLRPVENSERPLSERTAQAAAPGTVWGLRLFGAIFFLAGAGFAYGFFVRPWLQLQAASGWVETPCTIVSSTIATHSDSDGTTYSLEVRYEYFAAGEKRIGDRYNFAGGSSSSRGWREKARAAHPKGKKTVCFVDPKDPDDAVLIRELGPDKWIVFLPLIFVAVGLAIILGARAIASKKPVTSTGLPPVAAEESAPLAGPAGMVELVSSENRVRTFISLTVFALFWNGFVWGIFLFANSPFFAKVFLSIFIAVGALIALAAIGSFLAIFNPLPTLFAAGRRVSLGGSIEVQYRFRGNVHRLKRLSLTLRGAEHATYRRGTNTSTDKHAFLEIPLLDTTDRTAIAQGQVRVQIPANSMHSFEATNNKVVWTLQLLGEVGLWPKVKAEFPLVVLPRPTTSHA